MKFRDQPKNYSKYTFAQNAPENMMVPVPDSETPDRENDGYFGYEKGFTEVNMKPVSEGGKPPRGQQMNGLMNYLSTVTRYMQSGGVFELDRAIIDAGGYPKNAIVCADGSGLFISLHDDNISTDLNNTDHWRLLLDFNFTTSTNLFRNVGELFYSLRNEKDLENEGAYRCDGRGPLKLSDFPRLKDSGIKFIDVSEDNLNDPYRKTYFKRVGDYFYLPNLSNMFLLPFHKQAYGTQLGRLPSQHIASRFDIRGFPLDYYTTNWLMVQEITNFASMWNFSNLDNINFQTLYVKRERNYFFSVVSAESYPNQDIANSTKPYDVVETISSHDIFDRNIDKNLVTYGEFLKPKTASLPIYIVLDDYRKYYHIPYDITGHQDHEQPNFRGNIFAEEADEKLMYRIPDVQSEENELNGLIGMSKGYTVYNTLPLENGGRPPYGSQLNQFFKNITEITRYAAAGGIYELNQNILANGGYPKNAIVVVDDVGIYRSQKNNNTSSDMDNEEHWKLLLDFNYEIGHRRLIGELFYSFGNREDIKNNGSLLCDGSEYGLDDYPRLETFLKDSSGKNVQKLLSVSYREYNDLINRFGFCEYIAYDPTGRTFLMPKFDGNTFLYDDGKAIAVNKNLDDVSKFTGLPVKNIDIAKNIYVSESQKNSIVQFLNANELERNFNDAMQASGGLICALSPLNFPVMGFRNFFGELEQNGIAIGPFKPNTIRIPLYMVVDDSKNGKVTVEPGPIDDIPDYQPSYKRYVFAQNTDLLENVPDRTTDDQTKNGIFGYEKGFTEVNMKPVSEGGKPPRGQQMNGLLKDITGVTRYYTQGCLYKYDNNVSITGGGYPKNAMVLVDGVGIFRSLKDDNRSNDLNDGNSWKLLVDFGYYLGSRRTVGDITSFGAVIDKTELYLLKKFNIVACSARGNPFYSININWLNIGLFPEVNAAFGDGRIIYKMPEDMEKWLSNAENNGNFPFFCFDEKNGRFSVPIIANNAKKKSFSGLETNGTHYIVPSVDETIGSFGPQMPIKRDEFTKFVQLPDSKRDLFARNFYISCIPGSVGHSRYYDTIAWESNSFRFPWDRVKSLVGFETIPPEYENILKRKTASFSPDGTVFGNIKYNTVRYTHNENLYFDAKYDYEKTCLGCQNYVERDNVINSIDLPHTFNKYYVYVGRYLGD